MKKANLNTVALVTGGSSGIGYEIAKQFVERDYKVIIVSDNKAKLSAAAQDLGANVEFIVTDLSKPNGPEKVFTAVQALGYEVNILVNNAGVGVYGEFGQDTDLEKELAMIQLNVNSVVHLTKLFLPQMLKRGFGKILNTASMVSITSSPLLAVYGATKAFVYNFSEALRSEVKDKGIIVTALLPGATNTNFFNRAGAQNAEIAQHPEKMAKPSDVAKIAVDALMNDKDHVIAGFQNNLMAGFANILPKEMVADQAKLKQATK